MGVHAFSKGISPKVNVIARLEFELAFYDVAVQNISHYATGDPFNCLDPLDQSNLCKLFVLNRNTWNRTAVCSLLVFDRFGQVLFQWHMSDINLKIDLICRVNCVGGMPEEVGH